MKITLRIFLFSLSVNFTVLPAETSQLIGSQKPIKVLFGDDVILPCHLEPAIDVTDETVIWTRAGLDPQYVHFHEDGRLISEKQHGSYFLRTKLFVEELKNGNVSMKIFEVKSSDEGKYRCVLPSMKTETEVELKVDPEVIGSRQAVTVTVGQDVVLPCHLEPPYDARTLMVEWRRGGDIVHVYRSREDDFFDQDKNFRGRTSLFKDEMFKGNISLKLTNVTHTDKGEYICTVRKQPDLNKKDHVQLVVLTVKDSMEGQKTNGSDDSGPEDPTKGSVNSGVIVGGVIGGLGLVGLVIFLWWRHKVNNIGGRGRQGGDNRQPQREKARNGEDIPMNNLEVQ